MIAKCTEEIVEVPGFQIGIKRWGSPENSPVLAFHGTMDNAASFDFLGPLMTNVHMIAIDSPGCGKSSNYPPGILPQWLEECFLMYHVVNRLGLETFSLLGHSRGTMMVIVMSLATPERVVKGAFLDALGPPVIYEEKSIEFLRKGLNNYLNYQSEPPSIYKDIESVIKERMDMARISYSSAKAIVERGVKKTDKGYMWTYDRRLHSQGVSYPYGDLIKDYFEHLSIPLCLIRAKEGLKYPPETFQKRKSYLKNLVYHEVPGGHHAHMDNPCAVADILNQWYK